MIHVNNYVICALNIFCRIDGSQWGLNYSSVAD